MSGSTCSDSKPGMGFTSEGITEWLSTHLSHLQHWGKRNYANYPTYSYCNMSRQLMNFSINCSGCRSSNSPNPSTKAGEGCRNWMAAYTASRYQLRRSRSSPAAAISESQRRASGSLRTKNGMTKGM